MRIAFGQCYTDAFRDTGWTRRMRRIAEGLARAGHEVTVFCPHWWSGRAPERYRRDVRYRAITATPAPDAFAARLPGAIVRYNPDVVHVSSAEPWTVLSARSGASVRRRPVVAEWFGDRPDHPPTPARVDRLALRAANRVVTPSRFVQTNVREFGASDDRTAVIPESINLSLIERLQPAGEADLVYARRLDADANVEPFLLALAELRHRDWRATVIGDGPARPRLLKQASDLRIADRVSFPGALPLVDRVARYRRAHAFVQTATRSPFASELLWAMAAGCVGVVAYQSASSAHELVERRPRGIRVTEDTELDDAIADAASMEHRSIDRTFETFDHTAVRDRYLECYRTIRDEYGFF